MDGRGRHCLASASHRVHIIVPQNNVLLAFSTQFCAGSTGTDMTIEFICWNVVFAVLAVLRLRRARILMLGELLGHHLLLTVLTSLLCMEVVVVLLHVVDVNHLAALSTLFDVSAAV